MPEGRFIVLEGLDGSGITTQAELLRTWCEKQGIAVHVTKEPSDGPAGLLIKLALRRRLDASSPESLALLFAADRQDHVATEILPALSSGTTVICDRYYLSSFAYQLLEVPDLEWLMNINSKCPHPDLTVYLDVPPETCLERMNSDVWRGSDQLQLYEELGSLKEIRSNFVLAIDTVKRAQQRVEIVDGSREITTIHKDVQALVTEIVQAARQSTPANPQSSGSQQIAAILEGEPLSG